MGIIDTNVNQCSINNSNIIKMLMPKILICDDNKVVGNSRVSHDEWQQWKNLGVMWCSQVEKYGDKVMAVAKQDGRWRDLSWNQVNKEAMKITLGLMSIGVNYADAVGIFSKTRLEWIYSSLGVLMAGARLTCIYHTDSPPQCRHIITNSDTTVCFVEEQEQLEKVKIKHGTQLN